MTDKKLLGVCAWLSEKFELDVTGIRALFIVATVLGFGSPIIIYLILFALMPKNSL
ncbi:MAG: PspC domain-containing protein [Flavobacteriales bacterium]